MNPGTCPTCGADLPRGVRACPECGADERTGWSDEAEGDPLGLADRETFDHDAFVRREFGTGEGRGLSPAEGIRRWVWLVALGLVLLLLAAWLF